MLVHTFRGQRRVFGFTPEEAETNLPLRYGPRTMFKSIEIQRGESYVGVDVNAGLNDIAEHGFHLTDAHVRIANVAVPGSEDDLAKSSTKPVFVLVHGGWHNHSAWDRVTPILKANGFAALTLDLPGAGVHAITPKSLDLQPFDPAAFAAERSPVTGVTQEERTQAVVALIKETASRGYGKVILVGHSAGGMTISAVTERVPNLLLAVVYLAGFLVPNGMSLLGMLPHESMSSAQSPGLFVGDPVAIGATRINPRSTDETYRSLLKASFYGDVCDADFAYAASQLHCDEPNGCALAPSEITPERFGVVPRHYIRTTQDRAVPSSGQDHMIATVDGAIGGKTITHTLESSHSPFLSQPAALSNILIDICAQSLAEQAAKAK